MTKKKRVLIVEDEAPLAHALKLKLDFAGYEAEIAGNGQECINLVKKQSYDIILLDMMMPILNGYETLKQLQQLKSKIPVFCLSNMSINEDVSEVLKMGAEKYFIKSDIPLSEIVSAVAGRLK